MKKEAETPRPRLCGRILKPMTLLGGLSTLTLAHGDRDYGFLLPFYIRVQG